MVAWPSREPRTDGFEVPTGKGDEVAPTGPDGDAKHLFALAGPVKEVRDVVAAVEVAALAIGPAADRELVQAHLGMAFAIQVL